MVDLAGDLPKCVLQARQQSTVKNYSYSFNRWKKWASSFPEISTFPADATYVALYLLSLGQSASTSSPINSAFYSISWAHKLAGVEDPTSQQLPKLVRESLLRSLGHGDNKKWPVTTEMLQSLVSRFLTVNASLLDIRFLTFCLIAYAGFLRFDELINIRRCDLVFYDAYVSIFLEKSKTDVYRDGRWVVIASTGSVCCPVNMLMKYLHEAHIETDSQLLIFRPTNYCKKLKIHKLRRADSHLSYTTVREIIVKGFESIGLSSKVIGTHSLRAGGATTAASNGVADRLLKKHGRWVSDKSKDGYINESLKHRLSVSLSLGL